MKINIKATGFELTPSLKIYIEDKLGGLAKFVKRFDEEGIVEIWLEVGRTTQHHHKGGVFRAEVDLRLPKQVLRAEKESDDIHTAIDMVRDTLHSEIEKYKTRLVATRLRRKVAQ